MIATELLCNSEKPRSTCGQQEVVGADCKRFTRRIVFDCKVVKQIETVQKQKC